MKKIIIATFIISASIFFNACNKSTTTSPDNNSNTSNKITIEEAKDIALKHAKLSNDKVTFVNTEEGMEDGIKIYNIEFYTDNTEYDYEINADTGEIIEFDEDIEDYTIQDNPDTTSNQTKISENEAKDIALKHAKLSNDKVTFDRIEYDVDNGLSKYDIDFYYNNKEYSYEINAQTGEILSYEIDNK